MEGVTAFNYLLMMGLSAGVMPSVLGVLWSMRRCELRLIVSRAEAVVRKGREDVLRLLLKAALHHSRHLFSHMKGIPWLRYLFAAARASSFRRVLRCLPRTAAASSWLKQRFELTSGLSEIRSAIMLGVTVQSHWKLLSNSRQCPLVDLLREIWLPSERYPFTWRPDTWRVGICC